MDQDVEQLTLGVGSYAFEALAAGPADGQLVLLLHGFPQTNRCWEAQLSCLAAAGFRAVAPNQRGYSPGARPPETEAYHPRHLVADVLGMADALGAERFHVAGHDWGAAIAWQIAGRHGSRLASLTAVSVPHPRAFAAALSEGGDQQARSSYIRDFQRPGYEQDLAAEGGAGLRDALERSGLPAELADRHVEALAGEATVKAMLDWYRNNDRWMVDVGPIEVPTLYVWSTEDGALGRGAAEATADHVDGPYRFEVLEGVPHWVPELAAERLCGLLVSHVTGTLETDG